MNLPQKIESYLFMSASRINISNLSSIFTVSVSEVQDALDILENSLSGHGIMLVRDDKTVFLATVPESAVWFEDIRKKELSTPLSKGAFETLAIILYQQGATKPEIDYIRGVNSQFMLRNLLMRGLIEKSPDPTDKRTTRYTPSIDTLKYLGITDNNQLPERELFTRMMSESLGAPVSSEIDITDDSETIDE